MGFFFEGESCGPVISLTYENQINCKKQKPWCDQCYTWMEKATLKKVIIRCWSPRFQPWPQFFHALQTKGKEKKKSCCPMELRLKVNFNHVPEDTAVHGRFPQCRVGAAQRPTDRNKASSRKPRLDAMMADELLNVIRPSTAGYTRFMSETYLEKTEMSMSPERRETERLVVILQAFHRKWWSASACCYRVL